MSAPGDTAGLRPSLAAAAGLILDQGRPLTPASVARALADSGQLLGSTGTLAAIDEITAELTGLGRLAPLARDAATTDIVVNGPTAVWVDRGRGMERTAVRFGSEAEVRALAVRLIATAGGRLDDGRPSADVHLAGGIRVHAVLPPISATGTLLSIRLQRHQGASLSDLVHSGMIADRDADLLRAVMAARRNLLISGATGSGKTTLLAALLGEAASDERLVVIEDVAELEPDHPHTVRLQSRRGNVEGAGAVELTDLVREALRMRPDRLVVGECRGEEIRDLLGAMNTGHRGAGATVHANTGATVPARMVALGALAGWSPQTTALQCISALDLVIHLARGPAGRAVTEIAVFDLDHRGRLRTEPALQVSTDGAAHSGLSRGPAWERLTALLDGASPGWEGRP
ncbi:secretion system protein E [Tersicoccus phoenicis]|uniref:Secretion system protein E n=1 Tax=Tersicoccus phoenicis TaxID=554083 RepID=A0A1R1LHE8_9MICC|nr:TadA family conjugal transfer-associated ATPase [Tersicoccus phoenicis]OMH26961.1 secretion system protein E [Tersicoccus phoenicis]